MSMHKKIDPALKTNNDTGFGNADNYGGRFINKDGSLNLLREGSSILNRFSIYQRMLSLPRWKFMGVIVLFFLIMNFLFTILYTLVGATQLVGMDAHDHWTTFKEMFYFSMQTFTTVGYGHISPEGDGANLVAGAEAMTGFLSFAIATGLIYGRFARPQCHLAFSNHALIGPHKEGSALMFRFATSKDNHILTNVEIRVTIALKVIEEGGEGMYQFYDLELERNKVDMLPMNWTVVHEINDKSPLAGYEEKDITAADVELYVLVTGFDDVYSSQVLKRTSYTYKEFKYNVKFVPMYRESPDGKTTIMEMHKLNDVAEKKRK